MQPLEPNKEQLEALYKDVPDEVRRVIDEVLQLERANPPTIVKKIGERIRLIVTDNG
jgi:hypothetical protein